MKRVITTPITYESIKDLKIGDCVYLSGVIATCRDAGHKRVLTENRLPESMSLADGAIFHAGPIIRQEEGGGYSVVSVGPTTSRRMESAEAAFIAKTGVRLIVGKGGMKEATAKACREYGAIHCAFPGGCALVAADSVRSVKAAEWLDLGMPEAFWVFEVEELGPLIVSVDTKGNNLFENNAEIYGERYAQLTVKSSK